MAPSSRPGLSLPQLSFIVEHVFLPLKLPQSGDDAEIPSHESVLLHVVLEALEAFRNAVSAQNRIQFDDALVMIRRLKAVRDDLGFTNEQLLQSAFNDLAQNGGVLPIHVKEQNAAILVTSNDGLVIFEPFELSPRNESVIGTIGRLRRYFPASSIAFKNEAFFEADFCQGIVQVIAKMSYQEVAEMKLKVNKAGDLHIEDRDTTSPEMVTTFLATVLSVKGEIVQRPQIQKNTREEVLWSQARFPWRRSPLWLLVRVSLQRLLARSAPHPASLYKEFMIFLMAYILQTSQKLPVPSDFLHCMIAKTSRRLLKLNNDQCYAWLPQVREALSNSRKVLEERWRLIIEQSQNHMNIQPISSDEAKQGTAASYPQLDQYLQCIRTRKTVKLKKAFVPPWVVTRLAPEILPSFGDFFSKDGNTIQRDDLPYRLAAFEDWVGNHLEYWRTLKAAENNFCEQLYQVVKHYHHLSAKHYDGNPEGISLMVLTIMELWVASDKAACAQHHLMLDYRPEVPFELLQSLILPCKDQMHRLHRIEEYGARRTAQSIPSLPSLLSSFGHDNSFSVRSFDISPSHRLLKSSIEDAATQERQKKMDEFRELKDKYDHLMSSYESEAHHQNTDIWSQKAKKFRSVHNEEYCPKCRYKREALNLSITVHEWPLPLDGRAAKSTVFELRVPEIFNSWRNLTIFCNIDVLKGCYFDTSKSPSRWTLANYLPDHYAAVERRATLVSTSKPNEKTHRESKLIRISTIEDVLVNNGMTYAYFDSQEKRFLSKWKPTDQVSSMCTYKLPQNCLSLQDFLLRPFHRANGLSANHVISMQSRCPNHLSLEEFKSMTGMPTGFRLQWLNILANIYVPSVDFRKLETTLIVLQACRQAGPPQCSSLHRAGHQHLQNENFAWKLLHGLELSLSRTRENWESFQSLALFISLATRLLSLTSSKAAATSCLDYLKTCRHAALGWLTQLQRKVQNAHEDDERAELLLRLVQIALICLSTFFVDAEFIGPVLACPAEARILIETSILIQTTSFTCLNSTDAFYRILMQRWHQLMQRSRSLLLTEITQVGNTCLDDAIRNTWSGFPGSCGWSPLSATIDHWVIAQTSTSSGSSSLEICFNLLTAELLVDGIPLSRLPSGYEGHAYYEVLFGRKMMEVMPTDMPGMHFSSKANHRGHDIYFGKDEERGNGDPTFVAIHSRDTSNKRTLDFIPPFLFSQVLPRSFVHDYVHWYIRETDTIEFRPKLTPWEYSEDTWTMTNRRSQWTLRKGDLSLLSPLSTAVKRLLPCLMPLEHSDHIHVIAHSPHIEVELPRLQLNFFVDIASDKIYCQQYRGMYIDHLQQMKTLIGLQSKLVLRDIMGNRKILIPNGQVIWEEERNHVRVSIAPDTSSRVYPYDVDNLLGRLVGNGNLQSKLWLCLLHALTSYCLPDPLAGNTGTEQSLSMLDSAAMRSFDYLSEENMNTLHTIARLSPQRTYYPKDKRSMETIKWDPHLSSFCQHQGFYKSVKSILLQAARLRFLYKDHIECIEPETLEFVDPHLSERQSIRASVFYLDGFGAEQHTVDRDCQYHCRDELLRSTSTARAFSVSMLMHEQQAARWETTSSMFADDLYDFIASSKVIQMNSDQLSSHFISYDAHWLSESRELISSNWCQLHATLTASQSSLNKTQIMLCLATIAYSKGCNDIVLQTLVAFANSRGRWSIAQPEAATYHLAEGHVFDIDQIMSVLRSHQRSLQSCPERLLRKFGDESETAFRSRQSTRFSENSLAAVQNLANLLQNQWISALPRFPNDGDVCSYLKMQDVKRDVKENWRNWYQNHQFHAYLLKLHDFMKQVPFRTISLPKSTKKTTHHCPAVRQQTMISADQVFQGGVFQILEDSIMPIVGMAKTSDKAPASIEKTSNGKLLIKDLKAKALRPHEEDYVQKLETSFRYLDRKHSQFRGTAKSPPVNLHQDVDICQHLVDNTYRRLRDAVFPKPSGKGVTSRDVAREFLSPRASPCFFLKQLAGARWQDSSQRWRENLASYGMTLTRLQRARRLLALSENGEDLSRELSNVGHTNWNPIQYPKRLLLEIESDLLIRETQASIAAKMSDPPEGTNAVMQLNMGEGKSSVIVPIIAAHLANGTRLVRVIVAKPQAKELYQTLVGKLGGLLGHRIYHLPFSRSLRLDENDAEVVNDIHRECMVNGGVMLVQPEQILSLRLMGIECLHSGREDIGRRLLRTQHFLDNYSRDIVDESDENFSTKFELVYTMGDQQPVEFSPERWTLIQRVLSIFIRIVPLVAEHLPESIEVISHADGCFPRTRILRKDALDLAQKKLAEEICSAGLAGFPVARQSQDLRNCVLKYISHDSLSPEEIASVEGNSKFFTEATKAPLLLLRGLIAKGLLGFAFGQKRWRVNYGLAPSRQPPTKLAVPYRAKDCPSPRSEFSHVDIVILLTCLSYYYGGLSDDDLFLALNHLIKAEQSNIEYNAWVRNTPKLPPSFRQLIGINLKDVSQLKTHAFPHLRFSKTVIDYFLAHIVFSKEIREFPQKLSASGWDIGKVKTHPTTGFSGTNDSRHLLPLEMKHLDLEDQLHTNALVIDNLLQAENTVEILPRKINSLPSDAETLLAHVQSMTPSVQVILDVGAQVLEMSNFQVAECWLKDFNRLGDKKAVVFFNDLDELCVVDRRGNIEHLQTSPYSQQLDQCLVFLDESHTRGTDLKLPKDYRAAVTLGAGLTKDRLVQACMRMRKLGHGQSVVFLVSEEIETKIRDSTGRVGDQDLGVSDVVSWSISETWNDLRRSMPLWATQGVRYVRQKAVWAETPDGQLSSEQADELVEDEARSIEHRYSPSTTSASNNLPSSQDPMMMKIQRQCQAFDCAKGNGASFHEEQERELSPEVVQERQAQRPHPAEPAKHKIHPDVYRFIQSGRILPASEAFIPAFQVLETTSAAESQSMDEFPSLVRVTLDFMRTIESRGGKSVLDSYQRPVQWILRSCRPGIGYTAGSIVVIISPHEAQELMPRIESSDFVSLHLYAPRTSQGLPVLDNLDLYTIPSSKMDLALPDKTRLLLNLFAGQLYFRSYRDYTQTCAMLGLAWRPAQEGATVEADGFVSHDPDPDSQRFVTRSPVKFLMTLLTKIRRDCETIGKTHWGRILDGEILRPDDFEDP